MRKRSFRQDGGVALVEFALIAPVLLLILIGILDVGRTINAYVTISNAAREGSHYAALHPGASPDAIVAAVRARVSPLDPTDVTVSSGYYTGSTFHTWPSSGIPASSPSANYVPVQVQVTYSWNALTMVIGAFFPSAGISATSTVDTLR